MARPRKVDSDLVQQALATVRQSQDVREMRQAMAVLLPAELNTSLEQTRVARRGAGRRASAASSFSGASRVTPERPKKLGGRRRALDERRGGGRVPQTLGRASQSWRGIGVVAGPGRVGASILGRPVKASVVYRLLARHGWRKVAPDTRHLRAIPKSRRTGKKTPGRFGVRGEIRCGSRTTGCLVFQDEACWPDGPN